MVLRVRLWLYGSSNRVYRTFHILGELAMTTKKRKPSKKYQRMIREASEGMIWHDAFRDSTAWTGDVCVGLVARIEKKGEWISDIGLDGKEEKFGTIEEAKRHAERMLATLSKVISHYDGSAGADTTFDVVEEKWVAKNPRACERLNRKEGK